MLVVLGASFPASAQQYCVTCTDPDAKYLCTIGGNASSAAKSARGQLLCISELARAGHHASCSVGRSSQEPCDGQPRTVMFLPDSEAPPPPPAEPRAEMRPPGGPEPAQAMGQPEAPPAGPPQTVEDLAKQTVNASEKGLKKAGETVGNTAKSTGKAVGNAVSKTWKCVTSLFSDC